MLGAEAPRRSGRSFPGAARPLVSLRSPLPLIVAAIGVTLLVIAVVTLPPRPAPETTQTPNLSDPEVLTLVAHDMRSSAAAARVISEGQTRFDNGTWYVSVGNAHFRFTQRNRIVIAENDAAVQLEYGGSAP